MTILKPLPTDGGPALAHAVSRVELLPSGIFRCQVQHYATREDAAAKTNPIWQSYPEVPSSAVTPLDLDMVFGDLEAALVGTLDAYIGGTVLDDNAPPTLDQARAAQWVKVRDDRNAEERGGFTHPVYGRVDTDVESIIRMDRAAAAGLSTEWTLANNTGVQVTPAILDEILNAITAWADTLHAKGRVLREAIKRAETLEDIRAISWDAPAGAGAGTTEEA